jgi:hypothetical protein
VRSAATPPQAPGAVAALVRTHLTSAGDDFPGYDELMFVNLTTDTTLQLPELGGGARGYLQGLLQGGLALDPTYGGSGFTAITQLLPGQVYVTLVPSNTTGFNIQATVNGHTYRASTPALADGQVMYLTTNTQVAALTGADVDLDGSTDLLAVGADGSLTTWHNVTGGTLLTGLKPNETAGGHDLGVHIAGSQSVTIQGTVFQDLDNSGTWKPADPGLHYGALVYVDLNHDGHLDPGDPSQQPSLNGAYRFANLDPGTYTLRLALGANGVSNTMTQTFPANNAPVTVTVNAPGGVSVGNDFGVRVDPTSNDFNNDGHADLLLTDPATGDVYVQIWSDAGRFATARVGTLPGPDWRVAGVGAFAGDGYQDILLQNTQTGELRLWELQGGSTAPTILRTTTYDTQVPAGWRLAAVADYLGTGTPQLFLQDQKSGTVDVWSVNGQHVTDRGNLPASYVQGLLVGVGDLNGDGTEDLLWQRPDGTLAGTLLNQQGQRQSDVVIGQLPAGWGVADVMNFTGGASDDILLQEAATGAARLWKLNGQGLKDAEQTLDLGASAHPLTLQRADPALVPVIPVTPPADGTAAAVQDLYRRLLGRAADAPGLAYWTGFLHSGGTRGDLVRQLWDSAEHRGEEVDQLYATYLHRAADAQGRAAWVNALMGGMTETQLALSFLTSPEYVSAHPDVTSFVSGLYHDVLGRSADAGGLDTWVGLGVARPGAWPSIAGAILTSPEAEQRAIDGYYAAYLGRPADPAGQEFYVGQVQQGRLSLADVAQALMASDEFFSRGGGR